MFKASQHAKRVREIFDRNQSRAQHKLHQKNSQHYFKCDKVFWHKGRQYIVQSPMLGARPLLKWVRPLLNNRLVLSYCPLSNWYYCVPSKVRAPFTWCFSLSNLRNSLQVVIFGIGIAWKK